MMDVYPIDVDGQKCGQLRDYVEQLVGEVERKRATLQSDRQSHALPLNSGKTLNRHMCVCALVRACGRVRVCGHQPVCVCVCERAGGAGIWENLNHFFFIFDLYFPLICFAI